MCYGLFDCTLPKSTAAAFFASVSCSSTLKLCCILAPHVLWLTERAKSIKNTISLSWSPKTPPPQSPVGSMMGSSGFLLHAHSSFSDPLPKRTNTMRGSVYTFLITKKSDRPNDSPSPEIHLIATPTPELLPLPVTPSIPVSIFNKPLHIPQHIPDLVPQVVRSSGERSFSDAARVVPFPAAFAGYEGWVVGRGVAVAVWTEGRGVGRESGADC